MVKGTCISCNKRATSEWIAIFKDYATSQKFCDKCRPKVENKTHYITHQNKMKKTILTLLIMISMHSMQAQTCADVITIKHDEVEGTTYVSQKYPILLLGNEKSIGMQWIRTEENIKILVIKAIGASPCIDKGSDIQFLFRDGTRLTIKNENDFNCKNNVFAYFGGVFGKSKTLDILKSKSIKIIRIWTMDSYVELPFTIEDSQSFTDVINCMK